MHHVSSVAGENTRAKHAVSNQSCGYRPSVYLKPRVFLHSVPVSRSSKLIVQLGLTISVRQACIAAHHAVTIEDDRPPDRHASGNRNVKFERKKHYIFPLYGVSRVIYCLHGRCLSCSFCV